MLILLIKLLEETNKNKSNTNLNTYNMKKLFILTFASILTACNAPVDPVGAGFFAPMEGEKFVTGSDKTTDIWVEYIEAHNNQDMDKIMSMNSDSIYIQGPDGSKIFGKEEHKQRLGAWFEAENPKWEIYWAMPYDGVPSGATWIIAGHSVTLTVEGKEVNINSMIDGEIKDGKVRRFCVYNMNLPSEEVEEVSVEE